MARAATKDAKAKQNKKKSTQFETPEKLEQYASFIDLLPTNLKPPPTFKDDKHSYTLCFGAARVSVLLRQRAFFVLRTASNKQLGTGDKRHFGIGGGGFKR